MLTYNKDNRTLRIEKRLEAIIIKFINFMNQNLMVNKVSITAFMEAFIFRGIDYYIKAAYEHCASEREKEELDGIVKELEEYWRSQPWSETTDTKTRTISIDSRMFELLKLYIKFEMAVWKRDWTLNGLLIGGMMNGLELYLESDREFVTGNHIVIDFDYDKLIRDIKMCIADKQLRIIFRDGKKIGN